MIKKMERFIASLTDQEIDCQLKDIFEWAKIYKELLENEKAYRRNNQCFSNTASSIDTVENDYECDEIEDDYEDIDSMVSNIEELTIDYELAQMIQQKVSAFSEQKTREQLEKLKQLPTYTLSPENLVQLKYEIETCELHLFELTGEIADESNAGPSCETELEVHENFAVNREQLKECKQMYCYKCGTQNEEIARFCRACGAQLFSPS